MVRVLTSQDVGSSKKGSRALGSADGGSGAASDRQGDGADVEGIKKVEGSFLRELSEESALHVGEGWKGGRVEEQTDRCDAMTERQKV